MAVETVVIRITQDTRELIKTIDQLERLGVVDKENAASFRANANEFQKEQAQNQQAVRKTNKSIQDTGKTVGALDNQFRNLATTIAAAFTVQQIIQFTKSVIQVRSEVENTQIAFENMLGSASKATALLKDLQDFGARTPFNIQEVERGAQALLVAGENAQNVIPTLNRLGNAASGTNTNFQELVEVYGIFKVQNEILTQDLRQLTARGIPILQELASSFNISTDAVFDFASKGKIKFKDIEQAFINMSAEGGRFHDLMQLQSATTGGQISNLQDEFTAFKRELGEELAPAIRNVVASLREFVKNLDPQTVIRFTKYLILGVQALVSYKITAKAAALAQNALNLAKRNGVTAVTGFLGGLARYIPIVGGVISVLGLAASATRLFSNSTDTAAKKQRELKSATDDVIVSLNEQRRVMDNISGASLADLRTQEARLVKELEEVNDQTFAATIRTEEFAKARERLNKAGIQSTLEFDDQGRPILGTSKGEDIENVFLPKPPTKEELDEARRKGVEKISKLLKDVRSEIAKKERELGGSGGSSDKKTPSLLNLTSDIVNQTIKDIKKLGDFYVEAEDAALKAMKLANRERFTDSEDIRRADIESEIIYLQQLIDMNTMTAEQLIDAEILLYDKKAELRQKDADDAKKKAEEAAVITEDLTRMQVETIQRRTDAVISLTQALTNAIVSEEENLLQALKRFAKQSIMIVLKELQATFLAEQFKILATSIARSTFDPTAALGAARKIGIITGGFAAAQSAISAITFHDGTDYVPGGGGQGLRSDETWAKLQQGEGVVRQSMNMKYSGLVKAMNDDSVGTWLASNPKMSNRILKDMRQEILAQNIASSMIGGDFDDSGINSNLKKGQKADRKNTEYLARVIKTSMKQNPWGVGS